MAARAISSARQSNRPEGQKGNTVKITMPYACDICKNLKTEENSSNWFLGVDTFEALKRLLSFTGRSLNYAVAVIPWDDCVETWSMEEKPGVKHLCCVECAATWTSQAVNALPAQIELDRIQEEKDRAEYKARKAEEPIAPPVGVGSQPHSEFLKSIVGDI